jgi:hypothetical protein
MVFPHESPKPDRKNEGGMRKRKGAETAGWGMKPRAEAVADLKGLLFEYFEDIL